MLHREPLRFSTSALLRPLLQDYLLPTVAYVAGPGEINYWAQLAPIYDGLGRSLPLQQPLLVPRARFRCLDESSRALLAKLHRALVQQGLAWWYRAYSHEQTAAQRVRYERAETRARNQGVGLWQDPDPTPPWDYRRRPKAARR